MSDDEPVTIALGGRLVPRLIAAGIGAGVLGVALVVFGVGSETDPGEEAAPFVLAGLGAVIALLGVFCLVIAHRAVGAGIVIDRGGITWRGAAAPWNVAWDELDAVGVSVLRWEPPRAVDRIGAGERLGRIVLVPREGDPAKLRRLRTTDEPAPWTHRVSLGTNDDWTSAAEEGLRRFAGERYRGVTERETLRRRYS